MYTRKKKRSTPFKTAEFFKNHFYPVLGEFGRYRHGSHAPSVYTFSYILPGVEIKGFHFRTTAAERLTIAEKHETYSRGRTLRLKLNLIKFYHSKLC